jgi:hypothetical protein
MSTEDNTRNPPLPPAASSVAPGAASPTKERSALERSKDVASIVQSVATVIAIVVGGAWSYLLFIKERREYPHANLQQSATHAQLGPNANLLRVGVAITNAGTTRMDLKSAIIKIQQVLPLTDCVDPKICAKAEIEAAKPGVPRSAARFSWPTLSQLDQQYEGNKEIEPSEKDFIDAEFVLPSHVTLVRIYAYVRNDSKPHSDKQQIGWSVSNYYNLVNGELK